MPLCKNRIWPCDITIFLTNYGTTRGSTFSAAFRKEKFEQENFGKSLPVRQIHQDFLPTKFCIVQYYYSLQTT